MRRKLIKKYHLRRRNNTRNAEGGYVQGYDDAIEIEAIIWSAGGHVQAMQYGEKLSYVKNMEYEGAEVMSENDGICVYVAGTEAPDYRITSINSDVTPKILTLEKI